MNRWHLSIVSKPEVTNPPHPPSGDRGQVQLLTDSQCSSVAGGWMQRGPLWGSIPVAEA